ncbi:5-hydroxytryptamine receptor 3A-like [Cololabis saira]|uniref:5-hydroxytryptamine receptor 3A-like n=1 Tax=Cololabis saira TaxID=129043 RepID=UPI002AD4C991|nr:5-hydroxytryptamine receptor 3A-like [Cololabis saira]
MVSKSGGLKWLLPSTMIILCMFIIITPALCSPVQVNCSRPDQPSLLEALTPVFNLRNVRPVLDQATPTNISIYFTMYGILGVDEKAQLLVTYIWLHYFWMNEFVSWDQNECGAKRISLPKEKFWLPDIVINEFMNENKAPKVPYVYVYNNGMIHDALPVKIVSSCNLDIYTFPFDIQNCTLTFNSYTYYSIDIRVTLGRAVEIITQSSKDVMTTMGEWELLDITALKLDHNKTVYETDKLQFHVRVRRRSTMYVVNLLIPSCFLITLDLFSFILPPHTVDRSSFKMTLILGYTVFLLMMNELLPVTGNAIPLINVFFSLCLALMVASLLETILVTNLLSCSADFSPVPPWIQVLVLKILGFLVCMPRKTNTPREPERRTDTVVVEKLDGELPETKGASEEDKALQELRSLSNVLHALRSRVEEQQKGSQSSEDWIQCCQMKIKPSKLLIILTSLLMHASPCSAILAKCSEPDSASLLHALQPVFDLSPIRPVINVSTQTTVGLDFHMLAILGVDEKSQVLTTYIWQHLEWKNEFFTWNPKECGSKWIAVPRNLLWVPDIVINEFMKENSAPFVPYTYLHYSGKIVDKQPIRVVSACSLDIYLFPFDIQNCTFSFNAYIHFTDAVGINLLSPVEDILEESTKAISTMGEWKLVGITAKKTVITTLGGKVYDELKFSISVKRHATSYVVNLLIPSSFLILVDLFSFMLPPQNIDRSLFKMTLVLGYTVFLLSTNDMLPITGNTLPLINVFLSLCLIMMVTSLLETVFITNLLRGSAHYPRAPRWLRVFVLHVLGRLVRLPPKPRQQEDVVIRNINAQELKDFSLVAKARETDQKESLNEEKTLQVLRTLGRDLQAIYRQVVQQLRGSSNSAEWIQIGLVIDRLLFIFYIFFTTISFFTIIIIWVKSYNT